MVAIVADYVVGSLLRDFCTAEEEEPDGLPRAWKGEEAEAEPAEQLRQLLSGSGHCGASLPDDHLPLST